VQQENQFLRSLFDEAPLPYQALDSEGRLLTVNRAWQEELLYERHEVLGRWFGDFVCSDQKALFRERFSQFVEEGRAQGVIWSLIRKDGSTVRVSFSGRIGRDEAGRFQRSYCMFFDLTKRSEAEAQLRQSEELRMVFMESAQDGFGLFDAEFRLIYINQSGARMFDATPEELIGRRMTDISPGTEHTERYAQFKSVLETGSSFSIDEYAPPPQFGDRRFSVHAFKVGENLGVILRNVTTARLSEQRLQESETRWRTLVEESPDHVILLGTDLKIQYINKPLPGYTAEQMIGDYICHYSEASRQESIQNILEEVVASGEATTYGIEHKGSQGERIYFESRAVSRIVDGETVGLIITVRDISQRMLDQTRIGRLLMRQTAMAELSVEFGNAKTMVDIFRTAYQHISDLMDADIFIVTRYEAAESLIYTEYAWERGLEQNTESFLPVPLDPEGRGIQSEVIRAGSPVIFSDYREAFSAKGTLYQTSPDGQKLIKMNTNEAIADLARSALLVPMKIRGEVIGIMQAQSDRLDAFQ